MPATTASRSPSRSSIASRWSAWPGRAPASRSPWRARAQASCPRTARTPSWSPSSAAWRRSAATEPASWAGGSRCATGSRWPGASGSSAAATVGGLLAGAALAGESLGVERVLALATEIEGHPDNAAAALLGGFTSRRTATPRPRSGSTSRATCGRSSSSPTCASRRATCGRRSRSRCPWPTRWRTCSEWRSAWPRSPAAAPTGFDTSRWTASTSRIARRSFRSSPPSWLRPATPTRSAPAFPGRAPRSSPSSIRSPGSPESRGPSGRPRPTWTCPGRVELVAPRNAGARVEQPLGS